jgi:hypothetical protein
VERKRGSCSTVCCRLIFEAGELNEQADDLDKCLLSEDTLSLGMPPLTQCAPPEMPSSPCNASLGSARVRRASLLARLYSDLTS